MLLGSSQLLQAEPFPAARTVGSGGTLLALAAAASAASAAFSLPAANEEPIANSCQQSQPARMGESGALPPPFPWAFWLTMFAGACLPRRTVCEHLGFAPGEGMRWVFGAKELQRGLARESLPAAASPQVQARGKKSQSYSESSKGTFPLLGVPGSLSLTARAPSASAAVVWQEGVQLVCSGLCCPLTSLWGAQKCSPPPPPGIPVLPAPLETIQRPDPWLHGGMPVGHGGSFQPS